MAPSSSPRWLGAAKNGALGLLVAALAVAALAAYSSDSTAPVPRQSLAMSAIKQGAATFTKLQDEKPAESRDAAPAEDAPAEDAPAEDAPAEDAPADGADAAEAETADNADAAAEAPAEGDAKSDEGTEDASEAKDEDKGEKKPEKQVIADNAEADAVADQWKQAHASLNTSALMWQTFGGVVAIVGIVVLLYSEISSVMLHRDIDALKLAEIEGAPRSLELQTRELYWGNGWKAQYRGLASIGGLLLMIVGILVCFMSECPMIADLQKHYDMSKTSYAGNCTLLAFMLSTVNGVGFAALLTGICWSCTRTVPALLLIIVSISSDMVSTSNHPLVVLTWILFVVVLGCLYFYFSGSEDTKEEEAKEPLNSNKPREFV